MIYESEDVYWTGTLLSDTRLGVKDMERPFGGIYLPPTQRKKWGQARGDEMRFPNQARYEEDASRTLCKATMIKS